MSGLAVVGVTQAVWLCCGYLSSSSRCPEQANSTGTRTRGDGRILRPRMKLVDLLLPPVLVGQNKSQAQDQCQKAG